MLNVEENPLPQKYQPRKILLLVTAFNGLSQRIYEQLKLQGIEVSVCFAARKSEIELSVEQFKPDLILCPFLKQRIEESIWRKNLCIIIHPGIIGDRGPSSLDWAILDQESQWGATAIQASPEMDGGDIWASCTFPMRQASKASLYRQEISQMAVHLVEDILKNYQEPDFKPLPLDYSQEQVKGQLRPLLRQVERSIDWDLDNSQTILDKIRAADSFPGVLDELCGLGVYLFGAHAEARHDTPTKPKQIIGKRNGAICITTIDGAIWISHLKRQKTESQSFIKLPAAWVLDDYLGKVPELKLEVLPKYQMNSFKEISYSQEGKVGYLHFDFHNGAMSTDQCQRLLQAYNEALKRETRVLVLMGGDDFFGNGIHLNHIEASDDKAQESWRNINAIDDFVKAVLETRNKLTVASVGNNAGAGGAMLALACDYVFARDGVVFNPHYQSMGLYGSEYWTYTLPRRVGDAKALELTQACMPLGAHAAAYIGMVDAVFPSSITAYQFNLEKHAQELSADFQFEQLLQNKLAHRDQDEAQKPIAAYRTEELLQMESCFWAQESSYHQERYKFVYKVCPSETPKRLKTHLFEPVQETITE